MDTDGEGCFLVCDLDYPLELYDEHNSFPVLPEHLNGRLDGHLWDRKKIGLRYGALKEAIERGLILKKIHKGIKSKEEPFVRLFIQNNNKKRREAATKFEGDVFKLKNNAGYGKFGENKDNRSKVKFTRTEEDFKNEAGKPEFNSIMLLEDNVNVVCSNQMTVWEARPVSIAQAILDKPKL